MLSEARRGWRYENRVMRMQGNRVGHETSTPSRMVELDALRGIAAVAVLGYHFTTRYQEQIGHVGGMALDLRVGKYGVYLFFLISGFVIFMTLERTRTAMDFVVSRFSRLFPGYWAAIVLTAAVVYAAGLSMQQLPLGELLLNFTMVQEILGAEHLDGSYWTLQVELFFYVQMLFWFVVGQLRRIHWIIGGWLLLATVEGLCEKHHWHFSYWVRELLILRFIPFFALGILFYRMHRHPGEWRLNLVMVLLALLAIAVGERPVFLPVALACCAIFALFIRGRLGFLDTRLFVFLGGISYALYLVHQAIGFVVIHQLEQRGVPALLACLVAASVSLALAVGLNRGVERPVMAWMREGWRRRGMRLETT
ncbi:peptidoglycan/LPS O-acetylase OafA/YrhL [Pseudoxanthomonas sp. 3HH-4]|nr:peptidoglycan/LPS O-acetylase OafA/YrhL [Pseudoxanthomonas sp. 3HH-4]